MAVKVVNDARNTRVYRGKCTFCGCEFEYQGSDLSYHRNFPDGFLYCPRCKKPFRHEELNEIASSPVERVHTKDDELNLLKVSYHKLVKGKVLFIVWGSIIGGSSLATLLFTLTRIVSLTLSRYLWFSLIFCFVTGVAFYLIAFLVFGLAAKRRKKQIDEFESRLR